MISFKTREVNDMEPAIVQRLHSSKKVLLFIDKSALFNSLSIIHFLEDHKIQSQIYIPPDQSQLKNSYEPQSILPNSAHHVSNFSADVIAPVLSKQVIGTRVYISGQWPMIDRIKEVAYNQGFTDEEIIINGIGQREKHIFCIKCYQLNCNKFDVGQDYVCEHCKTKLDVSSHYSKRLNAFLGYIKIG